MAKSAAVQWGPCPCGGTYSKKMVEVRMTAPGTSGELLSMAQCKCDRCVSVVDSGEVLSRIEGTLKMEPMDRLLLSPLV